MDLYGEFEWRGLVYDATEGLRDLVAREKLTTYIGFDPTGGEPSRRQRSCRWLRARAAAALRPSSNRGRRRRHRNDRRSERQRRSSAQLLTIEQVETNVARYPRAALAVSRLRRCCRRRRGLVNNAEWLTRLERDRVHARRREATSRVNCDAREGLGEAAQRERRRHLLHRVQLLAAAVIRLPRPARSL